MRRFSGPIPPLGLLSLAISATAALAAPAVENPATPAHGTTVVRPVELWRVGGESDLDEEFFGVVRNAVSNADGTTFLLDEQLNEVRAFDESGSFVTSFGREGGGPGEFTRPRDLFMLPDGRIGVVHGFPARISTFKPDGAIDDDLSIGDSNTPLIIQEIATADGHLVALSRAMQRGDKVVHVTNRLVSIGTDGSTMTTYVESTLELPMSGRGRGGGGMASRLSDGFLKTWTVGPDGRVYVVREADGYEVEVYDPEGQLERTIGRSFARVKRSADELKRLRRSEEDFAKRIGQPPRATDPFHPDIARLLVRPDGSLWVLSSQGLALDDAQVLGTFDEFDSQGQFVRQVTLEVPFDTSDDEFELHGDTLMVYQQSQDAARAMSAGRRSAQSSQIIEDEDESDEELVPLTIVRYRI